MAYHRKEGEIGENLRFGAGKVGAAVEDELS